MKFINRHKEMSRLDRLAASNESRIAVVWGRRRMGKTRLLLEWTQKHRGIYFTADESSETVQRKYFSLALENVLPGFSQVEYPDWQTLFARLAQDALHHCWRGPLVIDELPYLIAASPDLPSILQKFIDHEAKKSKLIIALCGSSQRIMQGAALDASAPLYGRAHEIIKVGPISVGYIEEALGINDSREIIETYAVWGGIPRYWELVENYGNSFLNTIDALVLDPMGPLNDEPQRLLIEESPHALSLRPILDAIGLGAHRVSEIACRIGQPVTSLPRQIQRLVDLDLIEREIPFGSHEHDSKKALYKIKDPFIRFWFEVVASQRSFLAQSMLKNRMKWLKNYLPPVISSIWEDLCRQALPILSQNWEDGRHVYSKAGRFWHGKGSEWDIIGESHDGKFSFIGEVKWIEKTPSSLWIHQTIDRLKMKGFPPVKHDPKAKITYGLFIPEKPKNIELQPGIKLIEAADIIQALR